MIIRYTARYILYHVFALMFSHHGLSHPVPGILATFRLFQRGLDTSSLDATFSGNFLSEKGHVTAK